MENIYDGIQRPLQDISELIKSIYIPKGISTPALSRSKQWEFQPSKSVKVCIYIVLYYSLKTLNEIRNYFRLVITSPAEICMEQSMKTLLLLLIIYLLRLMRGEQLLTLHRLETILLKIPFWKLNSMEKLKAIQ